VRETNVANERNRSANENGKKLKMRFLKEYFTVIIIAVFFGTHCSKSKSSNGTGTVSNNCDTTGTISYNQKIVPIINASCGNNIGACHNSASSFGNFNNYQGFTSHPTSHILHSVLQDDPNMSKPMPPTGKMGVCDIAKIRVWIGQGALNN
jgi:hypothetical protein